MKAKDGAKIGDPNLRGELMGLDDLASNRFLEMGRRLRLFYDALPKNGDKVRAISELLRGTRIRRRVAMYWIEIDRRYSRYKVPDARLARIGWSKLAIIGRHLNAQNLDDWLSFAENSTANEVRARVRKETPSEHHVVFKLSAAENEVLRKALIANGALAQGKKRLHNKEAALIELCRLSKSRPVRPARTSNSRIRNHMQHHGQ